MAIAFDAYSEAAGSGSTLTKSHTCTGTDRLLVVGAWDQSGNNLTGVTYNGVSMTEANTRQQVGSSGEYVSMWYLANPASGANNVVATQSASGDCHLRIVSYTGCDQTDPIGDANSNGAASGSSITVSLTVEESTSWVVMFNRGDNGSGGSYSNLVSTARSNPAGTSINIGDSNGTVSSGAGSATYTASNGIWGAQAVEIIEANAAADEAPAIFFGANF